ncbi:T9SS C-terminal target domain-containing protein [Sphingobacteriales bacterium UPWRP_1]|nr:T9SS C-terminal target domain-containing protein [Sphingobacteriales bacterium UPWRP_1]
MGTGGTVSITPAQVHGTSTDNCGTVNAVSVSPNSFTCSNTGNNTVLLTVSDASGNTANCTATVTVGPLLSATASSNSPVCIGGTINLTATGGVAYSWSGPGGYTASGATPSRSGATLAMGGTYMVTVTNSSGCSAVLSTVVSVTATAAASITGNNSFCVGSTISLTASSGTSYSWSGPNGFTSAAASISLSPATTAMAGTYTVTVSNGGGCTASASKTITVSAAPNATVSGSTSLCVGGTITLTASGGTSYTWSYPDGLTGSGSTITRTGATVAMSGVYTVTVTNAAGCTSVVTYPVVVNPIPSATASSNSPVCAGSTINLSAPSGGTAYLWSGPNLFSSTLQNPTRPNATTSMGGVYAVTVTGAGGCTASASTSVTVNASPIVSVGGSSTLCAGANITLTATAGFTSYSWTGPNGFSGNTASVSITGASTAASGIYTVTVTNAAGCTGSAIRNVTVNPVPVATAGSNSPVCTGSSINLTASGGTSYSWSGPGGYVSALQNPVRTSATLAMGGTYTVTVSSGGCTATASTLVTVTSCGGTGLVVLTYSITKNSSTTMFGNGSITLNVSGGVPCTGASAYNYTWSPATGTLTASGTTATYSGLLAGTYTVTITDCGGNSIVQTYVVPNVTRGFKTGGDLASNLEAAPNPTSGMTTISFTSYSDEQMQLKVYSVEGREVGVLFNDTTVPDTIYEFAFDMNSLPSGTYYAVLETQSGERQQLRVMVVR